MIDVSMRESSLAIALAELIERLSADEQAQLAARLSLGQIQKLESLKRAETSLWREPEIYVVIGPDEISFETPAGKVRPFLAQLCGMLQPQTIAARFGQNGASVALQLSANDFSGWLEQATVMLAAEAVVIEFDQHTLYSNGGGCMMLKTSASADLKRRIAQEFLNICGVSLRVDRDRFIALVEKGRVEVLA